jgi:catecholate siderophore receptor
MGLKQEVLAGIELTDERSDAFSYNTNSVIKPADLFGEPGSNTGVADTRIKNPATSFKARTMALYGQNTVSLTEKWKLMGGIRYDDFDATYVRSSTSTTSRRDQLFSHRFGALYQPDQDSSYYISKGSSFNTSGDLYQFDLPQGQSQDSSKTPAEKSQNFEIGAKWNLLNGDLAMRTALFRTEKTNERNTDLDQASGAYLLSGRRHTDGIEFEAAGRITDRIEVFGGTAIMWGKIDKAGSTGQNTVGLVSGLTPRLSGNIWATYQVNDQWRVGFGADGMSGRVPAAAEASGNRAPGYIKADALIEYAAQDYKVKLNLNNLFNKVYVDGVYRGFTVWGPTRGAQLSLAKTF